MTVKQLIKRLKKYLFRYLQRQTMPISQDQAQMIVDAERFIHLLNH